MISFLTQLWANDQGQDIAEYAVMLAVILVLVGYNTAHRLQRQHRFFRKQPVRFSKRHGFAEATAALLHLYGFFIRDVMSSCVTLAHRDRCGRNTGSHILPAPFAGVMFAVGRA